MPRIISILLLFIMLGQAVQPAFAGDCCSPEMEMSCGEALDANDKTSHSCCSASITDLETPDEDLPHDCGDDCQCFCCMHVVFEIPQSFEIQLAESLFSELNNFVPSYSFQFSFSVFQPPRLV